MKMKTLTIDDLDLELLKTKKHKGRIYKFLTNNTKKVGIVRICENNGGKDRNQLYLYETGLRIFRKLTSD